MKKSLFLVAALLVVVPVYANHSWGGYHWARTANPLNLKIGDNMTTAEWKSDLGVAISDWDQSTVLSLPIVTGQSKGRCRPTSGRDEVCNDNYGFNGWLGLAQIWLSSGHIAQGIAKMNDSYSMNKAEKQHVVCQEVGHTFGLAHQSEDGSSQNTCMDYYSNKSDTDTTSTHPNQHDYDELGIIYAHLDSFNSSFGIGGTVTTLSVPVLADDNLDEPWRWGTPAGFDPQGRANVFVLDRGDDDKVITRVVWASQDNADRSARENNQ
ncbi:MAG TPA: hypothetical protein VF975_07965 [Thermoanaerobaculia bacterium]